MNPVFDADALYVAVDKERRKRRISFHKVCREAGVPSSSTVTRLGHGANLSADNLARLLLWLGDTDLTPYLNIPEATG